MKKIFVLILTLTVATTALSAGNNNSLPFIKFGAKFGLTPEKQNVSFPSTWGAVEDILNDTHTGYYAGITARVKIPLIPIFVQGELLYNWNNINVPLFDTKIKTRYFSAPVLVGFGIGVGDTARIRINAGPVFNFGTNVSWKNSSLDFMEGILEKPAVTWTAGVGVDFFGLMIDARYNGQFKKNEASLENIDAKPTSWTFSIGFLF